MSREAALTEAPPQEVAAVPRRRRGWVLPAYTTAVFLWLFAPIAVMIVFSFNNYQGRFNVTWQGFTLRWYRNILDFPDLTAALRLSIVIAAVATLIATALGTLMALALTRYRFRGRGATNLFVFLPLGTPEVVLGASLLSMFVTLNVDRGFWTILLAHVMFNVSFVVVTVKARTHGFNREWEEAAKDLGASPWSAFWTVTFPLIFPGILAAAVLAFALSVDDYVITVFNAGPRETFPLWVVGASRFGIPAQVNVMGTIIFLVGVALALGSVALQRRSYRGMKPEELAPRMPAQVAG